MTRYFNQGAFEIIVDEVSNKFSFAIKYKGEYIETDNAFYDLPDFFDLADLFQTIGDSILNYKKENENTRPTPITSIK